MLYDKVFLLQVRMDIDKPYCTQNGPNSMEFGSSEFSRVTISYLEMTS